MLVIVCGGDGVGKTSLCERIVKSGSWHTTHFSQPKDMADGKRQYMEFLDRMDDGDFLCDRFHDGEHVYAPLYRGYESDYLPEIEDRMVNLNANFPLLLYVTAEEADVAKRIAIRGEDYVKDGDHGKVRANYAKFMAKQTLPFAVINTSFLNREEALAEAQEMIDRARRIFTPLYCQPCPVNCSAPRTFEGGHCCVPRGNIDAKFVFVGQNPAHAGDAPHNTRMWTYTRSSSLLTNTLRELGADQNCWFTNAVLCETANNKVTNDQIDCCQANLKLNIETVDPQVVVALGDVAADAVRRAGLDAKYELRVLEHPAHAGRFNRQEQFKRALSEVINDYGPGDGLC